MKPINELLKLENEWLDEVYDRLWYEYFTPAEAISAGLKTFIREQLNFVANEHNKIVGAESTAALKVVGAKETWENDGNGPLSERKLYVSCLPAIVVPAPKSKKTKAKDEDDDLMGETPKPKKAKAAPATDGKGKYAVIAELAAKGKNKDQIQETTGFERKTVTDLLWRYNKLNPKK